MDLGVEPRGQAQRRPPHISKRERIRRTSSREHDPIARAITGLEQPVVRGRDHRPCRAKRRGKRGVGKVSELGRQIDSHVVSGSEKRRQHKGGTRQVGEHVGDGRPAHIRERELNAHPAQPVPHRIGELTGNHGTRRITSPVRNDDQTHRTPAHARIAPPIGQFIGPRSIALRPPDASGQRHPRETGQPVPARELTVALITRLIAKPRSQFVAWVMGRPLVRSRGGSRA